MIVSQEQLRFYNIILIRNLKIILKKVFSPKAFGLVEVLISLAVVSTGMVMVTSLSLKTLKVVRKNELQDISVQLGVEAMEFMKQPGQINIENAGVDNVNGYYYLEIDDTPYRIVRTQDTSEIDKCSSNSNYAVTSISETEVCQQINIRRDAQSSKYYMKVIIVWKTVGRDEYDKRVYEGIRRGDFKLAN